MERKTLGSPFGADRNRLSPSQLVTIEDLDQFKNDLLKEIRYLMRQKEIASERQWLKSGEVRRLLKISPGTLQHLRDTRQIPFTKLGGIIYYDHEVIKEMLRNR